MANAWPRRNRFDQHPADHAILDDGTHGHGLRRRRRTTPAEGRCLELAMIVMQEKQRCRMSYARVRHPDIKYGTGFGRHLVPDADAIEHAARTLRDGRA